MTGGHTEVTTLLTNIVFSVSQVLDEIAEHGIKIYQLPDADSDEDEEFKEQTRVLKVRERDTSLTASCHKHVLWFSDRFCSVPVPPSCSLLYLPYLFPYPLWLCFSPGTLYSLPSQASIPFAVIGSNQLIEVKGKKIRGRLYPWGVVEVENPEHNDFLKLRTMLVWVSAAMKLQHYTFFSPLE